MLERLFVLAAILQPVFGQPSNDPQQLQESGIAKIDDWMDYTRRTGDAKNGQMQHISAKRLRLVGPKDVYIRWRTKLLDQFAGGIMIAVDERDVDPGLFQPRHLSVEEQRRPKALQADVVEVASDDDEVNLMGQSGIQQLLEGAPRT